MTDEKINILQKKIDELFREHNELLGKIMRLDVFLCSKKINEIPDSQRNLLNVQFQIMRTYHQILRARINDISDEIEKIKQNRR